MLEMLAQVDPLAAVMAGVWLFAAGMLPVGIMLGSSCSPCCGGSPPCSQCTEGELPDTLTVTFGNFPEKEPGDDLIAVSLSSCFGSGATARVTAPGGAPGPISAVSVTNGGSGYARLGRVEPTLTAYPLSGSGSGATFSPVFTNRKDSCGLDWWEITSVSGSGGLGYTTGDEIFFRNQNGNFAAFATVTAGGRAQPTITAQASPSYFPWDPPAGSGASLSVAIEQTSADAGAEAWAVQSVTVLAGGSGYANGSPVVFSGAAGGVSAEATIRTTILDPTVDAIAGGAGSGAQLSAVLVKKGPGVEPFPGSEFWAVQSVVINNGGTGYALNNPVSFPQTNGFSGYGEAYGFVSGVGPSGEITAVTLTPDWYGQNGWYQQIDSGIVESVVLTQGGAFFGGGAALSASVSFYLQESLYAEDATIPAYVAPVTVSLTQTPPSNGTGAQITATVNSTVGDPDFGKITGLTITHGGSGYLAYELVNRRCCGQYYNGLSVVLKRMNYGSGQACVYEHRFCGVGNMRGQKGSAVLEYLGPSTPPRLFLTSERRASDDPHSTMCNTLFTATANVTSCQAWGGVAFASSGSATATVTSGGGYDPDFRGSGSCFICCRGEEPLPQEVEIELTENVTGEPEYGPPRVSVYVANRTFIGGFDNSVNWIAQIGFAPLRYVNAYLQTCAHQSGGGWSKGACETQNCHLTCSKRLTVDTGYQTFVSPFCECEETPLCDPYKEYQFSRVLREGGGGTPEVIYYLDVVVRAPL